MVMFNSLFISFISFLSIAKNWKYFFKLLLSLEIVVVSTILNMSVSNIPMTSIMYFLMICVLSSVVGIALLLMSIRSFGNDKTHLFLF